MDSGSITQIIVLIVLIILSGYFSATETAFSALNRIRVKNMASDGNKKAALVLNMSENFEFNVETKKILKLMIHSLHTNKDIVVRELVSNASDACDKIRYLSNSESDVLGEDKERHNHSGGIQLLTHNEISRVDLTEYAFIMALTKYINGEKWR